MTLGQNFPSDKMSQTRFSLPELWDNASFHFSSICYIIHTASRECWLAYIIPGQNSRRKSPNRIAGQDSRQAMFDRWTHYKNSMQTLQVIYLLSTNSETCSNIYWSKFNWINENYRNIGTTRRWLALHYGSYDYYCNSYTTNIFNI